MTFFVIFYNHNNYSVTTKFISQTCHSNTIVPILNNRYDINTISATEVQLQHIALPIKSFIIISTKHGAS